MATDSNIPFMSQVQQVDPFAAFTRGVAFRDSREDRARAKELQPVEDRIKNLAIQGAEQDLKTGAINQDISSFELNQQQALQGYDHALNLLRIPDPVERARVHAEFESRMGMADDVPDDLSDEGLMSVAQSLAPIVKRAQASVAGPTLGFTKGPTVKDTQNNLFTVSTRTNPQTGEVTNVMTPVNPGGPQQPVGGVSPVNQAGQTADDRVAESVTQNREIKIVNESIERGSAAVDQARQVRSSLSSLSEVEALLAGETGEVPRTGPVWSRLPSFSSSAIRLDQLRGQMGLDVIQSTTFGALSENELKFALDVALPGNLKAPEMRAWVQRKIAAQTLLANELEIAGQFLLGGGTTEEYITKMRSESRKYDRAGIDPKLWDAMTPEEKEAFRQ